MVECSTHGRSLPAFMCVHLVEGSGLGFFHSGGVAAAESRPDAWCGACEARRVATGLHWMEEEDADGRLVCGQCWDAIGARNATGREGD